MASLVKKTIKGTDYWYLIESKRVDGKVKKIILEYYGNTKKFTETLLNNSHRQLVVKSFSYGDTFALMKIAKKIRLEEILDETLPFKTNDGFKRSTSLMLVAMQCACNPGSKNKFAGWAKGTSLPYEFNGKVCNLTSRHFWEQMDAITEQELQKAEDAITRNIFELYHFEMDKVALDYTNYFTYIDSSNDRNQTARRGKNKQKRNDLRQLSLALVTTKESGMPICSYVYEGNKNDQTAFFEYIEQLKDRIPSYSTDSLTLIFDGGSNNKKNFEALKSHYICSFSLSCCKELYEIDRNDYSEIELRKKAIPYYRTERVIWGKERECILTLSESLYNGQVKELDGNIGKAHSKLQDLKEKLTNPKSRISKSRSKVEKKIECILKKPYLNEIFDVELSGTDRIEGLDYAINQVKRDSICEKYFGKKLIITDRKDWDAYEIIKTYREQDTIEKIFRDTKDTDHFSIRPQYHWTDQKIRVHIFCCLLGLTLATLLHKEVTEHGIHISKNELLDDLSHIRQAWIRENGNNEENSKVTKVLEEMDENETRLWNIVKEI